MPSGNTQPPSRKDFAERLRAARAAREERTEVRGSSRQIGLAYRVAIEMAAGLAVGAGLGWLADSWLGTRPIFLVALALLGFAAGVRNVMRAVKQAARPEQGEDRGG